MKDLKCCFGLLFEKYEKISKLEVLIGAQIVVTSAVVDLWVKRTMYPSSASVRMITGARSAFKKL